jgi:hypothetical protein
MSLGDFDLSAVIYFKFTTYRPSTGAPFALAGTPAISVYKDNSTTQSTTGVTLTTDFDSVTGLNHVAIDTSADGSFYSSGSFFDVVITTGTVDSVSAVGSVVGRFTIRKTADLKPTTAGRTLDVSATGEAGVDWANVGSPTTTLNLSGTTIKTATDVETDTADIQSRIPAALVSGRIDASVGAMATGVLTATAIAADAITDAKVADDVTIASVTGAVGSVTGNVGGNVVGSVASVTAAVTVGTINAGVITAAAIATGAIDADALAGDARLAIGYAVWAVETGNTFGATYGNAVEDILTDTGTTLQAEVDGIQAVTTKLDTTMELDGAVYRFTTNALEQGPAGAGGDPWDDALPGAYAAGTAGYILGNLSASTGSGARTVTITVNLSGSPVEGALVRLTKAAETYLGTTNASGVVTFNIDDGTWTVAITAANATYAGTTLVVDGNETATYSVTAIAVTPSSAPLRTGYLVCYDEDGVVESGVSVSLSCYYAPDTGLAVDTTTRTATSDVNGLVQFTNLIVGAKYVITRGTQGQYRFTVAAGSGSFAITSIVGNG